MKQLLIDILGAMALALLLGTAWMIDGSTPTIATLPCSMVRIHHPDVPAHVRHQCEAVQ